MQGDISVHTELDRKELALGEVIGKVCCICFFLLNFCRGRQELSIAGHGKVIRTLPSKNSQTKSQQTIEWLLLANSLLCAW